MPLQSGRNYTVEEGNEVGLTAGTKALDYGRRRHSLGTQDVSEPASGCAGGPWGHTTLLGGSQAPSDATPAVLGARPHPEVLATSIFLQVDTPRHTLAHPK